MPARLPCPLGLLCLGLCLIACDDASDAVPAFDASSDARVLDAANADATDADAHIADATASDAEAPDAAGCGAGPPCGPDEVCLLGVCEGPTPLPIGADAITRLSKTRFIDGQITARVSADGQVEAVWDTNDPAEQYAWAGLTASVGAPDDMPPPMDLLRLGPESHIAGPSLVTDAEGETWLYMIAGQFRAGARVYRQRWADGTLVGERAPVTLPGATYLLSWPRIRALPDGGFIAAFRDGMGVPRVASSPDGLTFGDGLIYGDLGGGALADVRAFPSGEWLATWQDNTNGGFASWFRISSDQGATWSDQILVTDRSANVHDTGSVVRADGGIDLYYIYPPADELHGFSLYRRSVDPQGRLGPEQRVTDASVGEPSKPTVIRLPDGRVMVMWAEIAERAPAGWPSIQRVTLALLVGEAPR